MPLQELSARIVSVVEALPTPERTTARWAHASEFLTAGQADAARELLRALVVEAHGSNDSAAEANARVALGVAEDAMGNPDQAVVFYDQVVERFACGHAWNLLAFHFTSASNRAGRWRHLKKSEASISKPATRTSSLLALAKRPAASSGRALTRCFSPPHITTPKRGRK